LIFWLLTLGVFLVAFSPTLVWTWQGWWIDNGYYDHGPLLLVAALWFVWARRQRAAAVARQPSGWAVVPLALCMLVHVAGQALMVDGLSGVVFVPALLCLLWAMEGRRRFAINAPANACLIFAVPLPIFVSGRIAYEMKHMATAASVAMGNLVGLGLSQDGANVHFGGDAPLVVGDACSGLRSLIALVALGWIYAFFLTPRRPLGRVVFIALAVPIALVANVARITTLAALAKWKGVTFASGIAHDVSGYLLYLVAIGILLALDLVLPGRDEASVAVGEGGVSVKKLPRLPSLLVGALGAPALLLAIWTPAEDPVRFAHGVPRVTAGFSATADHELPERWYGLLGSRDVCWRTYRNRTSDRRAVLTVIFQGRKWKSLHPPEVCLISSGMEIDAREVRSLEVDGKRAELTLLEVSRKGRRWLVGYAFGGVDFVTPSFPGFFIRNVPKALFRRDTRGFMLRVDVPIEGSQRVAAERLVATFLGEFLPAMAKLIKS
jgi:exosortase